MVAANQSLKGRRGNECARMAVRSADGISVRDFGVEEGVEQIGDQVGATINSRNDENAALNERKVVSFERKNHQTAETWIGEDRLDNDDAAHQPADIDGKNGDGRQKRVAQRMAEN